MTWEYIAGFFDGEGSIVDNGKHFRVTISQTELTVLQQIAKFAGVGKVIEVAQRKKHWKRAWVYYIAKQEDIRIFLDHIEPFLIVKRKKAEEVKPHLKFLVNNMDFKKKVTALVKEEALAMRNEGKTYREIGAALNKDFGYIRRLIKR